jgi:DNA-directed RNA polymerase subunit RPC12/RpoP
MKYDKKLPNHIRWMNEEYREKINKPFKESNQRGTKYGLTEEELDNLYEKQKYKCAICGVTESELRGHILNIDHDHKTEKSRGLLCTSCNQGLGMFKDNIPRLLDAIEYLRKHSDELSVWKNTNL